MGGILDKVQEKHSLSFVPKTFNMGAVKVQVKWQKETFTDLEVDLDQPPIVFKTQLFALTGVAPDRQKIPVKGGMLQDEGDWAKVRSVEGNF